jgi:hypothetical protein
MCPLNRHPAGGEKVPENCQPTERHNHFKKSSMHFARDAFAHEGAPFGMSGGAVLSWITGAGLGVGGWLSRDSCSGLAAGEPLSLQSSKSVVGQQRS